MKENRAWRFVASSSLRIWKIYIVESFTYGNLYRKENLEVGMSLKRNFWKGRRRKSVQVYIIHISKRKKTSQLVEKRREVSSAKCQIFLSVLPRREDLRCFVERDRKLGCWQRRRLERFLGRGERKEKEERDEGVAKRLEPNWNSNVTTARR